jgi:hypothetical protein
MRLPRVFSLLSAVCLMAGGALQADEALATGRVGVASRLVERGVVLGGVAAVGQAEVETGAWRAALRATRPIRAGEPAETRLSLAWRGGGETGWFAELSASPYARGAGRVAGAVKESMEVGATVGWCSSLGWRVQATALHDFRRQVRGGCVQAVREVALTRLGAFLETYGEVGWLAGDDLLPGRSGAGRRDGYGYGAAGLRLPYRVGERVTLEASVEGGLARGQSAVWSPMGRPGGWTLAAGLGVTFDF